MSGRRALLSAALVAGCLGARGALEHTMWLQMLVQIPLLVTAGVLAIHSTATQPRWIRQWNRQGMAGLVLAAGGVACWMIPRLLDAAAEHVGVDVIRALTLWAVGVVGALSWRAAGALVQLFVLGNMAWMTATVGLLLVDAPTRLCVNYGTSDQQLAGYGLLVITLIAVIRALLGASVAVPSFATPASGTRLIDQ